MAETAMNLPLDATEIRRIILDRLEKRMENNSLLATGIAYPGFDYDLRLTIKLEHPQKLETLVWDQRRQGEVSEEAEAYELGEHYQSRAPNVERQDHGLDLTVEAMDTRGKKTFKKVRIKTE
jgi:hypothetical protein